MNNFQNARKTLKKFLSIPKLPLLVAPLMILSAHAEQGLTLSSKSWFQLGQVVQSGDTLISTYNYNHNWQQSVGAQFTVLAKIGENWDGAMGFGGLQNQQRTQGSPLGSRSMELGWHQYVTQARLSYRNSSEILEYGATFGLFPYQYNTDVTNLGAYLLRGPVYPGFLYSEFESPQLDPTVANILGIHFHGKLWNSFSHDLILRSEVELKPIFDFSLIYLTSFKFGPALEIGGGVNLYRVFAIKPELTDLKDEETYRKNILPQRNVVTPYDRKYIYVPTDTIWYNTDGVPLNQVAAGVDTFSVSGSELFRTDIERIDVVSKADTTFLSHRGIKLMGRFTFDPKAFMTIGNLGPEDLKLYGEIAVIGTQNYKGIYDDIRERIPVMMGFNIPTFGLLDRFSFEVEYYGARYKNDDFKLKQLLSPIPIGNGSSEYQQVDSLGYLKGNPGVLFADVDIENMTKDNLKWSLYLSRTFMRHMKLSAQIANDHFRPGQYIDTHFTQRFATAFTRPEDFYVMFRIGYFF